MSNHSLILIVEDDKDTSELITYALTSPQLDIIHASDASTAQDLLQKCQPDLILLDLLLPVADMSGIDFLRIIKSDPALKGIPVIVVSAGSSELMSTSMALGSLTYITKPFNVKQLRQTVMNAVSPLAKS